MLVIERGETCANCAKKLRLQKPLHSNSRANDSRKTRKKSRTFASSRRPAQAERLKGLIQNLQFEKKKRKTDENFWRTNFQNLV